MELKILFEGMSPWVMALLIVGTICLVIEIFTAGFGFFGIAGGILDTAAIILRAIKGDGNPGAQVALMLLFIVLICGVAFGVMLLLTKLGVIKNSPLVSKGTAVDKIRSAGTCDYSGLLGKTGVTTTELRPAGRVEIDGKTYDAVTEGNYMSRGEIVKVLSVEGVKISVGTIEKN